MTTPTLTGGDGHYQQRVWKVSKDLDRLALMCEQHHRQTKHVDGLPDWTTPSMAAGVKTQDHVAVPANFAWGVPPPQKIAGVNSNTIHEDRLMTAPVASVLGKEHIPHPEILREGGLDDPKDSTEQSEKLRASSRDMLSRLSFSSTDSFPLAGGQATQETVRPLDLAPSPRGVKSMEKPLQTKLPREMLERVNGLPREPRPPASSRASENSLFKTPIGMATATHRHATDPPRRRKVQFADHDRSYRGRTRATKATDMTYQEALHSLASRRTHQQSDSTARTTYQETYQWPRRETLENMMDNVGGQTAGGPTRYERRRVFTAEDGMRVADESAIEFQPRRNASNEVSSNHKSTKVGQVKTQGRQDTPIVAPASPFIEPAGRDNRQFRVESPASRTTRSAPSAECNVILPSAAAFQPSQAPYHESSKSALNGRNFDYRRQFADIQPASAEVVFPRSDYSTTRHTRDIGIMTTPICLHEVSTQTDPLKRSIRQKETEKPIPSHHTGYCSHCGRTNEPASAPSSDLTNQALCAKRPAPSSHSHNPIFTNARFPPEPPVFRAKTTYSSEFGTKKRTCWR